MSAHIRIGVGGWTFEPWRGVFYPPGLAQAISACSPLGRLSQGVAGTTGTCLIVNVPGSTTGAVESIESVIDVLPHALELLAGGRPH